MSKIHSPIIKTSAVSKISPCCNHSISFCNIRGLHSNLTSVHQYLETERPSFLILSETQIKSPSDSTHLQYPNYELHESFRFKGGTCAFVRSDVVCCRMPNLESSPFDTLWLKSSVSNTQIFMCCLYRSPNDQNHVQFFSYLAAQIDSISSTYPDSQIILLGDFNVHNSDWLRYSGMTNAAGREAEAFAISHDLSQLVTFPTRIPDIASQSANTLDLFLTSDPENFSISPSAPLGKSDHCLIKVIRPITPPPARKSAHKRVWHYESADWDALRTFFSSFPWVSHCFKSSNVSECAEAITDTILLGMELSIPNSSRKISNTS